MKANRNAYAAIFVAMYFVAELMGGNAFSSPETMGLVVSSPKSLGCS